MVGAVDSPSFPLSDETLLEHAAWVRKVARELVRDPGTADDLAQETWLAFLRARPDPDRPLRPWFRTTLRNALSLRARRRSAQTWREAEVARPESLPSSDELLVKAEEQHRLARLVLDLDEPYRTTMLLRYSEGLTPSQIAEARGVPASTVRSHIHRGLAALRERLDADHGGDRRAWVVAFQPWALRGETASSVSAAGAALSVVAALLVIWLGVAWARGDAASQRSDGIDRLVTVEGAGPVDPAPALIPVSTSRESVASPTERSLTLVDERTQRPLASFSVRVDDRLFLSDAEGQVRVPASAVRLIPVDDPGLTTRSSVSHTRTEERAIVRGPVEIPDDGVIALRVGPTFRLDVSAGTFADLSRLRIMLVGEEPTKSNTPRQVASIRPAGGGFEGPWVRFGAVPDGADTESGTWRLDVRDMDGFVAGETPLSAILPVEPPLVHLDLAATGSVEGLVAGLTREQATDSVVMLASIGPSPSLVATAAPDSTGRYALRWIAPGAYTLRVESREHAIWTGSAEVHAGEAQVVDVSLDALPAEDPTRGPVTGIVRSETGAYSGQLLVFLLDADGNAIDIYPTTWKPAEEGQALEARFGFDAAPAGPLILDVVSLASLVTSSVMPRTFEAPRDGVEIMLRDRRPALDWRIAVLNRDGREPIERFQLEIRVEGGAPRIFLRGPGESGAPRWTLIVGSMKWNTFDGPTALRALPADATITWSVKAEGFATVEGDEAAFETDSSGVRRAEILLVHEGGR